MPATGRRDSAMDEASGTGRSDYDAQTNNETFQEKSECTYLAPCRGTNTERIHCRIRQGMLTSPCPWNLRATGFAAVDLAVPL
jgi:hypothetical protein